MKKFFKILLVIFLFFLLCIAGLLTYVKTALPDVGAAPDLKIETTPEMLERGAYLANNVVGCVECHSTRDFTKFAGPIVPGSSGQGGELFGPLLGFPGEYYAPNITPYGIGEWTDGEVYRAVTSGVSRDGRALFPIMPYPHFGTMAQEDVYAIIAYIRTLKPVEFTPPKSSSKFPMNFIINTIPKAPAFTSVPPKEELVKYGEYITNAALCKDCHTQQIQGEYQMDKYMAGGFRMPMVSGGTVITANITPDKKTGIGNWTEEQFVSRFKMYADSTYVPATVNQGEFNTMMPWAYYSRMKEEDLKAIFAYLQSIKPVENVVVKFEPPTQ
jgi:mono/diheme cytochrome c family protein